MVAELHALAIGEDAAQRPSEAPVPIVAGVEHREHRDRSQPARAATFSGRGRAPGGGQKLGQRNELERLGARRRLPLVAAAPGHTNTTRLIPASRARLTSAAL